MGTAPRKVICSSLEIANRFCVQVAKSLSSLNPSIKTTHRPVPAARRRRNKKPAGGGPPNGQQTTPTNKAGGTGGQQRSQKPCYEWLQSGTCSRPHGKCKFAHTAATKKSQPSKVDRPPCFLFRDTGTCRFGASCKFAHVQTQGPAQAQQPQPQQLPQQQPQQTQSLPQQAQHTHVPKSKDICRAFKEGVCQYGTACDFTHAPPAQTQPGWRDDVCWSWKQTGGCPYGPRCRNVSGHVPQ